MKIVLVYPRFKYPLVSGAIEPLGVQYLASVLKKEDLEVDIIDLTFETNLQLLNRAVINADYAGFSFTSSLFFRAIEILKHIKSLRNDIITIAG